MSTAGRRAKRLGIVGAALSGLGVLTYGATRIAAARIRSVPDDPDAERLLDEPMWVSTSFGSFDGGTINVVDREPPQGVARQDTTFLLSHGVTLSVRTWLRQLDSLPASGFRTIAFDHRGHGDSVLGDAGHSINNLAHDVRAVLERLDLHDVVLVGHSMGGIAMQAFLARYPEVAKERVSGLVLLSSLARSPGGSQTARLKELIEQITRRTPNTTPLWSARHLGLVIARIGFGHDPKPSHVELVRRMMLACSSETRTAAPRSLIGFDLSESLPRIDLPTLIVCGTADVITPPRESKRMARAIPGARVELLEGGGHMLMLERAEAVDELLVSFAHSLPAAR